MLTKLKTLSYGKRFVSKMTASNKMIFVNQKMTPISHQRMLMTSSFGLRAYSAAAIPAAVTEMENVFGSLTHQTYTEFNSTDLSFDSVLDSIVNLEKQEISFENFTEFHPYADELLVYFEELVDNSHRITAAQAMSLVGFGA